MDRSGHPTPCIERAASQEQGKEWEEGGGLSGTWALRGWNKEKEG